VRDLLPGHYYWIKCLDLVDDGWRVAQYEPGAMDDYGDWWVTGHELPCRADEVGARVVNPYEE